MHRRLRAVLAVAAVLLAGCSPLHDRHFDALDDDDEDVGFPSAAAFLGYHGPVERPRWD
jgi:hypothetical protein